MKIDTAIILCAGLGKRLNPLTSNTPKPLLELKSVWQDYLKKKIELKKVVEINDKNLENQEWITDSLDQLKKLNLIENEENDLLTKRKYILNQDKIISSFENARQILDSDNGLNSQMRELSSIFSKLTIIENQEIKKLSELINETSLNLEELSSSVNKENFNQKLVK